MRRSLAKTMQRTRKGFEAMTKPKLTPRQAMFASEFLASGNATQSAIKAGYSKRTAKAIGAENLAKPAIAATIAEARAKRFARNDVTAERVLQELARIAFFDVRKALNPDGSMKPLDQLDDDTAAVIAGIDIAELRDGDGTPIGVLKKIKIADKLIALDKLARNLGLLQDKLKISGDAENPLQMLIQRIQGSAIKPVHEGIVEEYDRAA
jgi:phage terminase small subunit